jgi:acyl CoA:acetate/3-ketoacid CoA transferase beta subunit
VVNLVITELGVFAIDKGGDAVVVQQLAPGTSLDEVRAKTGARLSPKA